MEAGPVFFLHSESINPNNPYHQPYQHTMVSPYVSFLPSKVRVLIRAGDLKNTITTDYCSGYIQTNLAIVPSCFADDFETFCRLNEGPLPLHYRSLPGELSAGPLAGDSDVTTDLPKYRHYRDGKFIDYLTDLKSFDITNHQSFYLGCSFTFDAAFLKFSIPVRHVEQGINVGMFRTSIPCHPMGQLKGDLVVSYRPIPLQLLSKCASISDHFPNEHGAPVHIGNPGTIGISSLDQATYGDNVQIHEGEVPVFWCCGVTVAEILQSSKLLGSTFMHGPGNMFITDVKCKPFSEIDFRRITVVQVDESRQQYSMLSTKNHEKLLQIEKLIAADPGSRGIDPLRIPEDFIKACLALSHADSVLLTTGFPCHTGSPNPYENDGPAGILTVLLMLLKLGKTVYLVLEEPLKVDMKAAFGEINKEHKLPIESLFFWNYQEYEEHKAKGNLQLEVALASERVAPGKDGNYYTMKQRALPKDRYLEPLENVIIDAGCLSIGIGDGGNEVGMGKVRELVEEKVNYGQVIASAVSTDLLITAGVSNWGTWGLAFGLYVLAKCPVHDRYKRRALGVSLAESVGGELKAVLPSFVSETKILEAIEDTGMADGICRKPMHVDGMAFQAEHTQLLNDLNSLVQ